MKNYQRGEWFVLKMRFKRGIIIFVFILILACGFFLKVNWIPAKYALEENEFMNYKPYILIQEVHYTGTGWAQVGDENGYYLSDSYIDVNLSNGNILPQMEMYNADYVNTFLCKVEYEGKIEHKAFEKKVDSYHVVEWYPVYPVLRDTILPGWLYPKKFMTKHECDTYIK